MNEQCQQLKVQNIAQIHLTETQRPSREVRKKVPNVTRFRREAMHAINQESARMFGWEGDPICKNKTHTDKKN